MLLRHACEPHGGEPFSLRALLFITQEVAVLLELGLRPIGRIERRRNSTSHTPPPGSPPDRKRACLAPGSPGAFVFGAFIATITPSRETAIVMASGGTVSSAHSAASNRSRSASQRPLSCLGSRSRLDFEGVMFPSSRNKSSPSCGVRCATTKAACRAASGVHRLSTIPARSSNGHTVRSPSPPRGQRGMYSQMVLRRPCYIQRSGQSVVKPGSTHSCRSAGFKRAAL
jgi:hypothetical protein